MQPEQQLYPSSYVTMNALPSCWLLQRGRDAEATTFIKITQSAPNIPQLNDGDWKKIKENPPKHMQ